MQRDVVRYVSTQTDYIVRPSQKELAKALGQACKRGEVGSASEFRQIPGTQNWAVKIVRIKPAPPPPPAWTGTVFRILLALAGAVAALALLFAAAGLLFGALVQVATPAVVGGALVLGSLWLIATRTGRRCCRVIVEVWH